VGVAPAKEKDLTMSNGSYERFGKLLATLGKLVLDDRRHLESVCAKLQSLVFDKYERPRSINWNAVRIVVGNRPEMAAIFANLDLNDSSEQTQRIVAAFADCFSEEEIKGPVPLSVIRARSLEKGREQSDGLGGHDDEYFSSYPESYNVLQELNLPFTVYATDARAESRFNEGVRMLPKGIDPKAQQGETVQLRGRNYVVMENNQNGVYHLVLTPAEFVDVTC
jgi:hypothetical protein